MTTEIKFRNITKYKFELLQEFIFKSELFSMYSGDITTSKENDIVYLDSDKDELHIKKHFLWDGSSVPFKNILRLIGWKVDRYCHKASLIHDALYLLMRINALTDEFQAIADLIYYQLCLEGGMPRYQADLRYWALRHFGYLTLK